MSYLKNNVCPFVKGSEQHKAWLMVQYMPHIFHVNIAWGYLFTYYEEAKNFNAMMQAIGCDFRIGLNIHDDGRVYVCALDATAKKKFKVHIRQLKRLANVH